MISDVLADALEAIEGYQQSLPQVYDELWPEIQECKAQIRVLLKLLDTPPWNVEVRP